MTDKCPECGVEGRRPQSAKNFLNVRGPNGKYSHIYGGLTCVQHQLAQRDKQLAEAQAENERLRAIVDKLREQADFVDHVRDWPEGFDLVVMCREAAEAAKGKP